MSVNWTGHDATSGGAMRDWYDNPNVRDVLKEQIETLPHGATGFLSPPKYEIVSDIPKDATVVLSAYLKGEIGTLVFMEQVERLRLAHMGLYTKK